MALTPFTWGSSQWGAADATWEKPGVYNLGFAAKATGSVSVAGQWVIDTSFAVQAVSDVEWQTAGGPMVAPDNSDVYVTPTTARMYMRLPAFYRDDDTVQAYDRPLLRYLAAMVDQAGLAEFLADRIAPPAASALTDPWSADEAWLPWLGSLVGLRLTWPLADVAEARAQIAAAMTSAAPRGSRGAIANVVKPVLSGTQQVTVTDHDGGQWFIEVNTLASQSPPSLSGTVGFIWGTSDWGTTTQWEDPDPIVQLIDQSGQKPAGFQIIHTES